MEWSEGFNQSVTAGVDHGRRAMKGVWRRREQKL